jgi:hypothetical protein
VTRWSSTWSGRCPHGSADSASDEFNVYWLTYGIWLDWADETRFPRSMPQLGVGTFPRALMLPLRLRPMELTLIPLPLLSFFALLVGPARPIAVVPPAHSVATGEAPDVGLGGPLAAATLRQRSVRARAREWARPSSLVVATSETSGEMTGSTAFASARVPVGFLWMLVPGRSFRARACRTRPFRGDRPFVVNRTPDEAPSSVSLGSSGQFSLPARTWPAIRSPSGLKT